MLLTPIILLTLGSRRYKPIGTQTGATENSKDGFETLRVSCSSFQS